ncbi:MAG: M15 family metallopeptidase [Bacteroidetes bacterium]|nr:M15 family metallopeptidase [Bacteroidota bacterium]
MKNKILYIWAITIVIILSSIIILQGKISNNTEKSISDKIIAFEKIDKIIESKDNITNKTTDDVAIAEKEIPIINKNIKEKQTIFVCPVPKKEYEDMWLLNIGQDTGLSDTTYIPKDLEKISSTYSARTNICLTTSALENLKIMLNAAKKDGYTIKVTSAFRTFEYQTGLLKIAKDNGNLDANLSISKPGYSEHQLGTAVDLSGLSINFSGADNAFNGTKEAEWLEEHASDYGFIESYPKDKSDITGYIYEPWHYRYIGRENAKLIKEKEQTISEFLTK